MQVIWDLHKSNTYFNLPNSLRRVFTITVRKIIICIVPTELCWFYTMFYYQCFALNRANKCRRHITLVGKINHTLMKVPSGTIDFIFRTVMVSDQRGWGEGCLHSKTLLVFAAGRRPGGGVYGCWCGLADEWKNTHGGGEDYLFFKAR